MFGQALCHQIDWPSKLLQRKCVGFLTDWTWRGRPKFEFWQGRRSLLKHPVHWSRCIGVVAWGFGSMRVQESTQIKPPWITLKHADRKRSWKYLTMWAKALTGLRYHILMYNAGFQARIDGTAICALDSTPEYLVGQILLLVCDGAVSKYVIFINIM